MTTISDLQTPVDRQHFYFQFVTTPTSDTPGTTLLLHFNNKRYLFGRVAEGTQRAFNERGVSLKKSRNIFLTGETRWENNGGLLGMILTMADVLVESNEEHGVTPGEIKIWGGPKLWHSVACARRFIFRTGMPLRVFEADAESWRVSQQPDFVDENILLWGLPVKRNETATSNNGSTISDTVTKEQELRQKTVHDMFDSGWKKDRLTEAVFKEINLPAMIWVRDPETKDLQATFCTKMDDAPHIQPEQKVLVRMPWPAALLAELPPAHNLPSTVAMSYFVKGRPQRGAFMPKKAKELGVPAGPNFGLLANGQSINLDDGRVIKPEDVLDETLPGPGMAVLDVPDVDYLSDLLQKLVAMQEAQLLDDAHAFIWIVGAGVVHSEAFVDLISRFPSIEHIVASSDSSPDYLAMQASGASATRLNQIRPEIFAVPKHNNTIDEKTLPNGVARAERGLILQAAPKFEVTRKEVPDFLEVTATVEGMSDATRSLIPMSSSPNPDFDQEYNDVSIRTLGTGSAMPSKYRNVSANLLHIPTLGYFIFDAGEDTLGQLKRSHSPEELDHIIRNLHMIWISHLHADHHLGTISILVERAKVARRLQAAGQPLAHKLYLISERNMADYLEDYKSVEANDAVLLRCVNSQITDLSDNPVNIASTTLPVSKLDTTRVSHCHGAQAVSVTFSNGFKLSYSGDCRPSAQFAEIGQDSDVLIHEATFDDGMEGDAMAKKHCTIGEALGVAVAMKAKNVILTHFSQRYQKLPVLTNIKFPGQLKFEEGDYETDPAGPLEDGDAAAATNSTITTTAQVIDSSLHPSNGFVPPSLKKQTSLEEAAQRMSICIAFDLMRVTIPQIKDMYKYYPAIEHMFEVEQTKSDDRRAKLRDAMLELDKKKNEATEAKRKKNEGKKGEKPKPGNKRGKKETNGNESGNVSGISTPNFAAVEE